MQQNSTQVQHKNELLFLENLKFIMKESEFKDTVKILYLYIESIISVTELYLLLKPIFVDEKLLAVMVDIAQSREAARRKNVLFRPLVESDVKCKLY